MTAKNAVTKNTDLTNFSLMRETSALFPGSVPTDCSLSVMVCHLPVGKKVRLRDVPLQLLRATYPCATTIFWPSALRR
jgi:hypothetical protein